MRNFESFNPCTYFTTVGHFLNRLCNFFCRLKDGGVVRLRYIDEIIYFYFWNHKCMSDIDRSNIEKCVHVLVLVNFIRRNLSVYDACKYRCHAFSIGTKPTSRSLVKSPVSTILIRNLI